MERQPAGQPGQSEVEKLFDMMDALYNKRAGAFKVQVAEFKTDDIGSIREEHIT